MILDIVHAVPDMDAISLQKAAVYNESCTPQLL
jgi:hypothetical protein